MVRFDVYANPGNHAKTTPYLLDAHSNLLDCLDRRMVIPLRSPLVGERRQRILEASPTSLE